jgi:pimeloyl-ACP methyl ester carboxylesterase
MEQKRSGAFLKPRNVDWRRGMWVLKAGGREIEYERYGSSVDALPTIVFLHGGLGCVSTWGDFPSQLAEATGCPALAYSRAGYGGSQSVSLPRTLRFMHDEALISLPEVLEQADVRDSILFGHSDGASIALIYAAIAKPKSIRAIIVEAPHVFVEDITVRRIGATAEEYRHGDLRPRLQRHHGTNVDCAFWGWNTAWLDPSFKGWNIEEYLPAINVPVLIIQGQHDEYGTMKQVEAIEGGVAGSVRTVIVENCGHAPHRTHPHTVLHEATSFILQLL